MAVGFVGLSLGLYRALRVEDNNPGVVGLSLSDDGSTLAIACANGDIYLLDVASRGLTWTYAPKTRPATATQAVRPIALSADGNVLAIHEEPKGSGAAGEVVVWDTKRCSAMQVVAMPACGRQVTQWNQARQLLAFSRDGNQLAVACLQGGLRVIDVKTGTPSSFPPGPRQGKWECCYGVRFNDDNRRLEVHGSLGVVSFTGPSVESITVDTVSGVIKLHWGFHSVPGQTKDVDVRNVALHRASAPTANLTATYDGRNVVLSSFLTEQPLGEPIELRFNRRVPLPAVVASWGGWLAVVAWLVLRRARAWRAARSTEFASSEPDLPAVVVTKNP